MNKYNVYGGIFKCQVCNVTVNSLRHYVDEKELTWMCHDKHISRVSLDVKKKKSKYNERKN